MKVIPFFSWCMHCKKITATGKEKLGKGQGSIKYCKSCGNPK